MATEYRQRPGGMGDHFDDEDLVMSSAQQRRNWRGILIALMVIVAVLAMIVTSVVLLTPPQPEELLDSSDSENGDRTGSDYYYNQRANDELWWRRRGMRALRLSDILSDSASMKLFNGTWISGNEIFYVTSIGDLAIMEIMEGGTIQNTRQLMPKKMLQKLKGSLVSFELSPDRNHILIGHDAKKIFRYSKTARYTVYTVSTEQLTPIILDDRYRNETTFTHLQPHFLHVQWHSISTGIDKSVESMALIAVYRYDVFYVPWSIEVLSTMMDTDIGKINITTDSRVNNTNNSHTSSLTSYVNDKDDNGDNNTSSKLSWKPWPYGPVRRITTTGSSSIPSSIGIISNGVADYLYEMEILKRSPAVWPSSGRYLMYATFDDRRVGEYKYSVYMKGGRSNDKDGDKETKTHGRQQKQTRKKKRRRRRIRRNVKPDVNPDTKEEDETSEYYLYPDIHTIRYPKANTPNPIVTLSVIVNLDQLDNPQIQPKIRTLTPPPKFQYTDDYYFTAVQWVNDGGISGGVGSHEMDDDKSGASAAEVCVVWLNRAQNTSITTLCKSPMWMCQETQVINAVGSGAGNSGVGGEQAKETFSNDHARRRYRRNGGGLKKSPTEIAHGSINVKNVSSSKQEDRNHRRQQHHQHQHTHQHNGHHSRRRRAGDVGSGHGPEGMRGRYGGWVDATLGGAGGGVPSTGGSVSDGSYTVLPFSETTWWSGESTGNNNDDGENFIGDDGYVGIAGIGDTSLAAGYSVASLVRKGWETGDKELTPRAPVFAADGQGYVSVAPIRDEEYDDDEEQDDEGGVRLRRPTPKQNSQLPRSRPSTQSLIGKYFAQVVAVNITKKLLAPLTFGELDDDNNSTNSKEQKKKNNVITKSWTVVRVLAWDQRTDMIYFLAVPSGRGAPHHRHLYAVKFTSAASSTSANVDAGYRVGHHHQQQYRKTIRHNTRSRPLCLSCDVGSTGNIRKRERREFGGKQNRMDEARDNRLRQQQRERLEHLKEQEEDNEEEAATAEAERRQQRNRRQQQEMQNRGTIRHCTYYDAQFSRDGSHYALMCLGPSVPYVTLHRLVVDDNDDNEDNSESSGVGDGVDSESKTESKWPKDSSYSFEFISLLENNTRLQDKYTNRVLLPGTRTFQLRLSGGRKLTTSGGLNFNDPLAAADYYSNGGDQHLHYPSRKRPDSDPLTVAQVRLYLPLGVYDPEADPRPEFMSNHVGHSSSSISNTISTTSAGTSDRSSTTHNHHRRRRSSSSSSSTHNSKDDVSDRSKRHRRQRKQQRQRRYKKVYPLLVVVNSDPGSQAITDRFADRLGYTTGLLCSGSGKTFLGGSGRTTGARYSGNEWDHRRQRGRRDRRSSSTRYYSSGHSDDYDDESYDYYHDDDEDANNNEYVVAVIDTGRGTWARGYESLLALNYGDSGDGSRNNSNGDDDGLGRLLGTSDLRDQLEAVEYLLSSATTTSDDFKDGGQGYYSEDRPRGGRGSRDRSTWFSSTSQSNRRYYSDDDYYDEDEEYYDNDKNNNDDYYYYYYSNGGDNSDYGGGHRGDDFYRDSGSKTSRRNRRSTSDTKTNTEALRLPYVDANKVALLGGGPTTPSTPSSIYGGYAATRMALWQTIYGGAPIERRSSDAGNIKEPVAIRSSFKCALTMSPICSWRLYTSAFSERYYGYYGGYDGDSWTSYDRSDLIPFAAPMNKSSLSPSSYGKGINLLVVHGTADTNIHPQHSMMLVRGVMQQQQQQYVPSGPSSNLGRRNGNSTISGGRVTGGFPIRTGAIRISQLVMPDADLSNSRMTLDTENGSPVNNHHQLLHSIYSYVTQYLATECFTGVGDGIRGRDVRIRGRRLRKRRRRWRAGNRDQEKAADQKHQLDKQQEEHPQFQPNQRSVSKGDISDPSTDDYDGSNPNTGGRYRRHDIDSTQHILDSGVKDNVDVSQIKSESQNFNDNNKTNSFVGSNSFLGNHSSINSNKNRGSKIREKDDDDDDIENGQEDDDDEDSDDEYEDGNDSDDEDDEENDNDDDK